MTEGLPEEGTLAYELMKAHEHAALALTMVYKSDEVVKGLLWRLRLLRAESILMKLMLGEVRKPPEERK